jgi:TATA-box binding protein (TBP) (component of TFIID and TFIIIB)
MKIKQIKSLLLIFAIFGLLFTGCKKENSTSSFTNQEIVQVQNSDVQDAIADKNDQDVDNSLDQLQVVNYVSANLKSVSVTGSRVITVDHPDSTTFPKVITIVYTNYQDSTADEKFVKNGEIDVTVTVTGADKQLVTRAQTFKNFSVTTDSTTITVKGTRTVARTAHNHKFTGLVSLRLTTTDNITANLSYAITKTGVSDTLKFTRVVNKVRKGYLHYLNTAGTTWQTVKFKNIVATDTVTYSGTVTGINEKGSSYSKTVSARNACNFFRYSRSFNYRDFSGFVYHNFYGRSFASTPDPCDCYKQCNIEIT